jgi:S1-C subfamily serine protease
VEDPQTNNQPEPAARHKLAAFKHPVPLWLKLLAAVVAVVAFWAASTWQPGMQSSAVSDAPLHFSNSNVSFSAGPAISATATQVPAPVISQAEAFQQTMINVFARAEQSIVNIEVVDRRGRTESSGSGFVYDSSGNIITNAHVIEDARTIFVTFRDGYVTEADIVGTDAYSDLAVIRVRASTERLISLPIGDSNNLRVGQSVIAIGNPFGLNTSMTIGIISATGRTLNTAEMLRPGGVTAYQNPAIIQIDVTVNPGNSGGPLLNLYGEVIGINSAIRTSNGYFEGVAFAVPSNTLRRIVPQLIENGTAQYTWLGITSNSADNGISAAYTVAALAEQFNLPIDYGVLIVDVVPNSPAAQAGLRGGDREEFVRGQNVVLGGDIIVSVNGTTTRDFDQLIAYLVTNTSPGDEVKLGVYRDKAYFEVSVTLGIRPG